MQFVSAEMKLPSNCHIYLNFTLLFVIQSVCTGAGWIEYTLGTDYKIVTGYRAICLHTGDIKFPTASDYCCVHHWNLLAQS